MDTNIVKVEDSANAMDIISKYADVLDPQQLDAVPLLAYDMPYSKVAKYLGLQPQKVQMWIKTDPNFRAAIDEFKDFKRSYHGMMLDQLGTMAMDRIFEYLSTNYGQDDKMIRIQADVAKFVLSQIAPKSSSVNVNVNNVRPQLHVTEDSAAIIARKVKELQDGDGDIIDSEYRIAIDNLPVDQDQYSGMEVARAVDEFNGEDFDAEIKEAKSNKSQQYVMHPDATYGELDYDESTHKWLCHICGKRTLDLVTHVRTEHKLSPARYRTMYGLSDDAKFYVEQPMKAIDDNNE